MNRILATSVLLLLGLLNTHCAVGDGGPDPDGEFTLEFLIDGPNHIEHSDISELLTAINDGEWIETRGLLNSVPRQNAIGTPVILSGSSQLVARTDAGRLVKYNTLYVEVPASGSAVLVSPSKGAGFQGKKIYEVVLLSDTILKPLRGFSER